VKELAIEIKQVDYNFQALEHSHTSLNSQALVLFVEFYHGRWRFS
jgi:hypothetical protein